jgi:hypothetical protein
MRNAMARLCMHVYTYTFTQVPSVTRFAHGPTCEPTSNQRDGQQRSKKGAETRILSNLGVLI